MIEWPLHRIQLGKLWNPIAKKLIADSIVSHIISEIQRTEICDLHWKIWAEEIERVSKQLIEATKTNSKYIFDTNCSLVMEGMGNSPRPHKFKGKHRVGVTFFERSDIPSIMRDYMNGFDCIITGSKWNQQILEENKVTNSVLVHQGIDQSIFNSYKVPRLTKGPL